MSRATPACCAIYTRKSNENGLEQDFNSLDAQREACEAYVKSQAHEGWLSLAERYDDGGFSGGSIERPALRRLLTDISAGKIDTIVVYKIDRLTRSLADFARMVDLFDRHQVTFVSVTQAFNTTSSMGRLTLNVLLSFAQFEREVTGERIRDKIAASKAKGLWMGGYPPLGYEAPRGTSRILLVNEAEALIVRRIFHAYLELRSVKALLEWLEARGITPKQWTTSSGREVGASRFSRSALYYLLRNPIYRGMIRHKSDLHLGGHAAIVDEELFQHVQLQLERMARKARSRRPAPTPAPLTGRIFDAAGRPMAPSSSQGKSKQLYRYYSSKKGGPDHSARQRVPGLAVEGQLRSVLKRLLPCHNGDPLSLVKRVEIQSSVVSVLVEVGRPNDVTVRLLAGESANIEVCRPELLRLELPLRIRNRRARTIVQLTQEPETSFDHVMIGALRRAHALIEVDRQRLPVLATAPQTMYQRRLVRLAFLAPDLQAAVFEGRQPAHLTLEQLIERPIPIDWEAQRSIFRLDCARSKLRHRSEASTLAAAKATAGG